MTIKHTDHDEHEHHTKHAGDEQKPAAASPGSFNITPTQVAFANTLQGQSDHDLTHLRKVASDVSTALPSQVVQTIENNQVLGGPERAADITADLQFQANLLNLAAVISPLAHCIAQNLMVVNARLGQHVSETLKLAEALERTQPDLLRALQPEATWSNQQHGTHHAKAGQGPTT